MTKRLINTVDANGMRLDDEASIRQLYHLYYRPLCYFAEKLIGHKAEAEDIAVDSFLKLLRKKDDFTHLSDIRSFLFTATRNACFDHLRKNKSKDRSARELSYLAKPDEQFGEREMITSKVLQIIYTEIESLPPQCRTVFTSLFLKGKSTAETAAEMGISPQTVLNQKTKALGILRTKLYEEGLDSLAALPLYLFLLALYPSW